MCAYGNAHVRQITVAQIEMDRSRGGDPP